MSPTISSTLTEGLVLAVAVLIVLEAAAWFAVLGNRRKFPWLITVRDIEPSVAHDVLEKYARLSFDSELGWRRKPGTVGTDASPEGDAQFEIAQDGARVNPGYEGKESSVVVYGDSYAFCRLVNNDETWPHDLSRRLDRDVRNFGVGNYGLDQALLRYEREAPTLNADVIIFAVVPETVVRVHSYWKHYFEYGNTLAFKPMFRLQGEGLEHLPPAVSCAHHIAEPARWRDHVRHHDRFYREKFLPDLIRFPAIVSIARRLRRHGRILLTLLGGMVQGKTDSARRRAFETVLDENHRHQRRLFVDPDATELLRRVIKRFADACESHGAVARLVIIPQPRDLRDHLAKDCAHTDFVQSLAGIVPVLDLTPVLARQRDKVTIYKEGNLGPHTGVAANRLIAAEIHRWLAADGLVTHPAEPSSASKF